MNESHDIALRGTLLPTSWKWFAAIFSYLTIMHLFLVLSIPGLSPSLFHRSAAVPYLWVYLALVGVSGWFGWRSRQPLMAEAAAAGLVYFTLVASLLDLASALPPAWRFSTRIYAFYAWAVVLPYSSAAVGMFLHQQFLRKADPQA